MLIRKLLKEKEKPGWFMFCKKENESYIHQLEKKETLERKEWVQSKQNKIQERRRKLS